MKKVLQSLILLLGALMLPATAYAQQALYGDVNGNNEVDISDVTALIGYVLTGNGSSLVLANADCTLNGEIDISDVTCLIDYILHGSWPDEPVTPPDNYEYVDLGLPSGTLWATCNIGANSPEDYGDYFAWGETAPKSYYYWTTYKWCNYYYNDGYPYWLFTKYCDHPGFGENGFVDNKKELDLADDAAHAHSPGGRMPSVRQFVELFDYSLKQWTQRNGVNGWLFTGFNGNSIFLPAVGIRMFDGLYGVGSYGYYWSRTIDDEGPAQEHGPEYAYGFYLDWQDCYTYYNDKWRSLGYAVRAVRDSRN